MNEYSSGKKGAAVVFHQLFFVLMICSVYANGYYVRTGSGGSGYGVLMVVGLVGSFVALAYLTGAAGRRTGERTIFLAWTDKLYTDVELALLFAFLFLLLRLAHSLRQLEFELSGLLVAAGTLAYLADFFFLLFYLSFVRRAKTETLVTHSLLYHAYQFFVALASGQSPRLCTQRARERRQIQHAIEAISAGALDTTLDVQTFHGQERELAAAVNHIREGLSDAVMESIKNERMKADLITNVSHDIKTPLTSIVNYVDLLKRENLENENARRYLRILDEKSQRLKLLIEDLVEASKISSGNIRLELADIDMVELLYQTGGEFNERFEARGLTIVTKLPNHAVPVHADGRQLYRAIENLYTNAAKYALENTRVYVELEERGHTAAFAIKNVSRNPLPENAPDGKDLTERFVRGEESRTTEGSGLGLSIAKNLTQLMGGELQIHADGDLFIAVLVLPLAQ